MCSRIFIITPEDFAVHGANNNIQDVTFPVLYAAGTSGSVIIIYGGHTDILASAFECVGRQRRRADQHK